MTPAAFRDELEAEEGDVTVWINSPGGNVFAAAEIYTMLCDHRGKITVKLRGALNTGNAGKGGSASITIGIHRKDWSGDEYYPAYVEFGHGGPRPAPAHPFVRPAIDAKADEAISVLIEKVAQALK